MERTLILAKPDAYARNLTGEILARFERKGLRPVALRVMTMTRADAERQPASPPITPTAGTPATAARPKPAFSQDIAMPRRCGGNRSPTEAMMLAGPQAPKMPAAIRSRLRRLKIPRPESQRTQRSRSEVEILMTFSRSTLNFSPQARIIRNPYTPNEQSPILSYR